MHDNAVFYVRNLRSYPNFTSRLHFFADEFDREWLARRGLSRAANGAHAEVQAELQEKYRGFSVVRPLPGAPVGRTVLPCAALRVRPQEDYLLLFSRSTSPRPPRRLYSEIEGVPFQQQDHAVSACATAALWSALDSVASIEELPVSSPANIAEAATRYPLQEGRAFPTEGLTVKQICEASRSAGFSPIVISGSAQKTI